MPFGDCKRILAQEVERLLRRTRIAKVLTTGPPLEHTKRLVNIEGV